MQRREQQQALDDAKLDLDGQTGNALVLSREQAQKISELQSQLVNLRRDMRDKQKGLQSRKDQLYSKITWLTVAVIPLVIALTGFAVWIYRRRTTRAV